MDDSHKSLLNFWRVVLVQYLNPVAVIEELPEYFPVDSRSRNLVLTKDDQPHEAVDILLDELMSTDIPDAYSRFLEAVKTQHPWLIPIITGEMDVDSLPGGITKIQFQEYVNKLLTRLLPTLVKGIIATNISMHMKVKGFLNQEEHERIEAKTNNSGNTAAVRTLLAILVRKPIEWLSAFKNTIREENYTETVRDVVSDIPDNIEKFSELSYSMSMRGQSTRYESGESVHYTRTFREQDGEHVKACMHGDHTMSFQTHDMPPQQCEISLRHCNISVSSVLTESQGKEVLQEESQFHDDKALFENLHGTAIPDTPKFPPASSIIPKEAGYVPRQSKGRVPSRSKTITRSVSEKAVTGENAIIFADERLDIAWNIIETRFPHILDSTDRKIAFIVPKITKDYDALKYVFASQQWSVGFYTKDEHSDMRELMQISQVIVITGESFLSWLNEDSDVGKLSEFDVLIFDQCFTSYKNASYKEVLLKYLSVRQTRPRFIHTQVIGLASSMNAGKLSGQNQADNIIFELIALFDARGGIEVHLSKGRKSKKNAIAKMKLNSATKGRKSAGKKDEITDPLTYYLCEQIDGIVDLMYRLPMRQLKGLQSPRKIEKGSTAYIKWCDDLLNRVSEFEDPSLVYHITNCAKFLRVFNVAFLVKNKCRASDASDYLENNLNSLLPLRTGFKYQTVEKRLTKVADVAHGKLRSLLLQDSTEDCSSLTQIHHEVTCQYGRNKHSQILIIVNNHAVVDYMQSWLKDDALGKDSELRPKTACNGKMFLPSNVTVCHCDELPRVARFDMIIRYDCSVDIKCLTQKKANCQKLVDIECEIIKADDKVKISNILLMNSAIEKSQNLQIEDHAQYIRQIEQLQSRLLVRKAK